MPPILFYKCLADETRLQCVLLIQAEQELCACELMQAMHENQPKISRHLTRLQKCGLLTVRRQRQWVFYSINPTLPKWILNVIAETITSNAVFIARNQQRLAQMANRLARTAACCA